MTKAKHTPGPSEAGASGDVVCELCRDFGFIMLLGDDGKETAPVTCYCHKALPELLQHAKKVMEMLEQHGPSIVPHLIDTDDNPGEFLRAAIAKVEGGVTDDAQD